MSDTAPRTARFAAIDTLCRLEQTRLPVGALFDKTALQCRLSGPDHHLAINLINGVLRQRHTLEFLLQSLCRQPIARIKPFVRQALLIGLYQIFFLDRIPESAAVNESVKALQAAGLPKNLQGFVNAVLRESLRQKQALAPQIGQDRSDGPFLNHPDWLTDRWQKRFGLEAMRQICAANNRQSPLILQVNTLVVTAQQVMTAMQENNISVQPGSYSPDALILPDFHGAVNLLPGFDKGHFQIQDEAAQLLPLLLTPIIKNGRYLDACAGLGGKTGNLIQLCAGSGAAVVAVEPEPQRQQKFCENMQRLYPAAPVTLHSTDLQGFARTCRDSFNGILIDAPCSGTGVTGRHPDIRWSRQENDLARYQLIQLTLLEQAAGLLAADGTLVYATCSLEPEENENVIAIFLDRHPEFIVEDCTPFLPPAAEKLVVDKYFAPLPGPSTDGFFGARLVRAEHNAADITA